VRSGDGRALRRSGFLDLDLKLICPNGSTSGRIFDDQTMLRTMQDLTRLRQRRNSFITVVLIITLIVIIRAGATVVNQGIRRPGRTSNLRAAMCTHLTCIPTQ
jgi:hypothetical protein